MFDELSERFVVLLIQERLVILVGDEPIIKNLINASRVGVTNMPAKSRYLWCRDMKSYMDKKAQKCKPWNAAVGFLETSNPVY